MPRPPRTPGVPGVLLVLALLGGCDLSRKPPAEVYRQRNRARLEFESRTQKGYGHAVKLLVEAIAAYPNDADDRLNLARALVFLEREGAPERALEALASARALLGDGNLPVSLLYLEGLAASRKGDTELALERFRAVSAAEPECVPAWYQLGTLLLGRKETEAAVEALAQAAARDSGYLGAGALFRIHEAWLAAGRRAEAEAALGRFRELRGELPRETPGAEFFQRSRHTRWTLGPCPRADVEPPAPRIRFRSDSLPGVAGAAEALLALDVDADGDLDLLLREEGGTRLLRRRTAAAGEAARGSPIPQKRLPAAKRAVVADFSGDGFPDLLLLGEEAVLLRNRRGSGWETLPGPADIAAGALDARWGDTDGDGRPDLILLIPSRIGSAGVIGGRVLGNLGDGQFRDVSADESRAGLPWTPPALPAGGQLRMAVGDFDGELGLEAVLPGADGARLFGDLGGGFGDADVVPGLAGNGILLAGDLDNDGDLDVAGLPSPGAPFRIARNEGILSTVTPVGAVRRRLVKFRVESSSGRGDASNAALDGELADLDNDGDLDVVLATPSGVRLFRNRGGREFGAGRIDGVDTGAVRGLVLADLDGDGLLDLLVSSAPGTGGGVSFFRNRSSPAYRAYTVRLLGGRDRPSVIGARVDFHAGKLYQVFHLEGSGGARFGVGSESTVDEQIDGLRIRWPDGAVQAVFPGELRWDTRRRAVVTRND